MKLEGKAKAEGWSARRMSHDEEAMSLCADEENRIESTRAKSGCFWKREVIASRNIRFSIMRKSLVT
jgi:hypothetical protein